MPMTLRAIFRKVGMQAPHANPVGCRIVAAIPSSTTATIMADSKDFDTESFYSIAWLE